MRISPRCATVVFNSDALEASILDRYEEWLYPVKGRTLNCLSHAIEEALFFPIHAELLLLYRLLVRARFRDCFLRPGMMC